MNWIPLVAMIGLSCLFLAMLWSLIRAHAMLNEVERNLTRDEQRAGHGQGSVCRIGEVECRPESNDNALSSGNNVRPARLRVVPHQDAGQG